MSNINHKALTVEGFITSDCFCVEGEDTNLTSTLLDKHVRGPGNKNNAVFLREAINRMCNEDDNDVFFENGIHNIFMGTYGLSE